MKILIRLILGIVVLVVLAGGALFVASQQQPSIAQGLKPVATSAAAGRSFDGKVEALNKAAAEAKRTGKAQTIEIAFTEEELTTKVAAAAGQQSSDGIAARNIQIHLSGTNIIATSTVTVGGVSVNLGIVAEPTVVNGQTQIIVKEIQTGAVPIPDAITQEISAQIGSALDPSKLGLPIDISQLAIVDGKLVIKGTANP